MEYMLVSLRLSLVRYGFVEVRGCFHGPSCTENVAGIHACIRGRGQGSLDPPENRRNVVFPSNAGPVKNHKVANLAIISLPANSMAFRWWPDVVTLTVSLIKKVKVGSLCQNIMPPTHVLRLKPPPPLEFNWLCGCGLRLVLSLNYFPYY